MAVEILGLTFNLYGLILGVAILCAYEASRRYGRRIGLGEEILGKLFWWVVIGGIIGARLYHVIDKWNDIYSADVKSIFYLWNGGLGIWGAILGGLIGLAACVNFQFPIFKNQINFYNLLDVVFLGLPLGQAVGRWGNFVNNELVGKNGEPLFLYESIASFVLFGGLVLLGKKSTKPGEITGVYLIGYGLIRGFLEQLRPEEIVWKVGGIPMAMVMSVVAVGSGAYFIWRRRV